jgi:two-component system alkaline phosphatase synthesis response regulator PhoP
LNSFLSRSVENCFEGEPCPRRFLRHSKAQSSFASTINEEVLECEKSFLESFGYTVLTAASGGKGLELASKHSVDVVILDYFMPEMNGQEVAIAMRRLKPQAPIILLTGAVDVPEQALNLVDVFIAKDRLASQLLPAIAQLQGCGSTSSPSFDARRRRRRLWRSCYLQGRARAAAPVNVRISVNTIATTPQLPTTAVLAKEK